MVSKPVLTMDRYPSNAELIGAAAALGWLRPDDNILDPTYGLGTFWETWRGDGVYGTDLNPRKSPDGSKVNAIAGRRGKAVDATDTGLPDRSFDVVVVDGPYKLSGTPALGEFDERYGIAEPTRWQDRMALNVAMVAEAARVADRAVLVKCMDQVVSGRRRWQTREFAAPAEAAGYRLADRLDFWTDPRPQPEGRRQVHSLANYSTLLYLVRKATR